MFAVALFLEGAAWPFSVLIAMIVETIPRVTSGCAFGWTSLIRLAPYAAAPPLFYAFAMGIADRSAAVKKVALDALTRYRAEIPDARKITERFLFIGPLLSVSEAGFLFAILTKRSGANSDL